VVRGPGSASTQRLRFRVSGSAFKSFRRCFWCRSLGSLCARKACANVVRSHTCALVLLAAWQRSRGKPAYIPRQPSHQCWKFPCARAQSDRSSHGSSGAPCTNSENICGRLLLARGTRRRCTRFLPQASTGPFSMHHITHRHVARVRACESCASCLVACPRLSGP
jgi:hypothetical protein